MAAQLSAKPLKSGHNVRRIRCSSATSKRGQTCLLSDQTNGQRARENENVWKRTIVGV